MHNYIEKIASNVSFDFNKVRGYSDEEIKKIERLYDISISGDFENFLQQMGRSDGGLIGDDPIILYRNSWSVRSHIKYQLYFWDLMQEDKNFDYLNQKPFVFACESETLYVFMQTSSQEPLRVHFYDENSGTVTETDMDFSEYLQKTAQTWGKNNHAICQGDLIVI